MVIPDQCGQNTASYGCRAHKLKFGSLTRPLIRVICLVIILIWSLFYPTGAGVCPFYAYEACAISCYNARYLCTEESMYALLYLVIHKLVDNYN